MDRKPNRLLRLARKDAGLTQEGMAGMLGVASVTVYRWETGQRMPSSFQRTRLCVLLGKSNQELGWPGGEEEKPLALKRSFFVDPSVPVGQPLLANQGEVLTAIQAWCLAPPARKRSVGLVGMPGCGKTALAAALLALPQVHSHFSGVLWATVGQCSTPQHHLARWAWVLGIDVLPDDVEQAKEAIRIAIGSRRVLIVLDDLWKLEDLTSYALGGPGCQYVVTTRHTSLARQCDAVYRPAPLSTIQAVQVLSRALSPWFARKYQGTLRQVATNLGNLPLALEAAGTYLRQEASSRSQRQIQAALSQQVHPVCYLHNYGTSEQASIFTALARSEQWLSKTARQALGCLATQYAAAPATFSLQQACEMLQYQGLPVHDLDRLLDAGLLDTVGESRYQIHPVVSAYARLRRACSIEDIQAS